MAISSHISTPRVTVALEALSAQFAAGRAAMARRAKYKQTINEFGRLSDRDLDDTGFRRSEMNQTVSNELKDGKEK